MTPEEMERAIDFLVKSQAKHDTQIGELREAIAETNRIVQLNAETVTEFIQAVTGYMSRQGEVNGTLARAINATDARLDRLAATVERYISEGGKA